tara:strand:+ start:82 stop:348 length:267 start_codon:yes stop_codon:yes gene_type:complete
MDAIGIILTLLQVLFFLILARVVISWIPMFTNRPLNFNNPIIKLVFDLTEPLLAPLRRFLMIGMLDLSPIALIIIIQVISGILAGARN